MDLIGTKLNNIGCVSVKKNKKIGKNIYFQKVLST
jgi:hypothetical protein